MATAAHRSGLLGAAYVLRLVATAGLLAAVGARGEDLVYHPRDVEEAGGAPRVVVQDPDAHGGTAQAAVPGMSRPDSTTATLYSYARGAAIYRVTWRLKIDDNTMAEPVLKVATHDAQSRAGFKGGGLDIKGTDFKEKNQYQEFTYTAEKPEGGFFNVSAVWKGKGRVHLDWIKVAEERAFTEKEIIERQGKLDLPEVWNLPKPNPPVVHLAKGLWWNFFGISESLAELGGAVFTSSYHTSVTIRGFPGHWRDFMRQNLIMVANLDAQAMGPSARMLVGEYVANGGAVFFFGGPRAFERGQYRGTALEKLLPFEMTGKDRVKAEGGLVLRPAPGAKGVLPEDLAWALEPRLYYYHDVQPRPEAQVLMLAGDKPLLMTWSVGKGRVAALAASAEGDPAPGQIAFWEWGDMPRVVAGVSRWLMAEQAKAQAPTVGMSKDSAKLLDELLSPTLGEDVEKRQQQLQVLLPRCRDRAFALDLLMAVENYEGKPDRTFVAAVARAVKPYVDAEFEKVARGLIGAEDVGKAALGLQVLGMSKAPGAGDVLRKFLESGTSALRSVGQSDTIEMDDLMAAAGGSDVGDEERIKLAAVIGLGDLGDPVHVEALRNVTKLYNHPASAADPGEVVDLKENLVQQSLAARAKLGDVSAAGPFLAEVQKNAGQIEIWRNYLDVMLVDKNDKELMYGRKMAVIRLPVLYQRQALCMEMLRQLPFSVYPAIAAEIVRQDDETLIPFAYAALAPKTGQKLPPETAQGMLPLVERCRVPELRLLAFDLVAGSGVQESASTLGAAVVKLAAGEVAADVVFALRRLGKLKDQERAAVVRAALKHPDAKVHRIAVSSLRLLPEADRKALSASLDP